MPGPQMPGPRMPGPRMPGPHEPKGPRDRNSPPTERPRQRFENPFIMQDSKGHRNVSGLFKILRK